MMATEDKKLIVKEDNLLSSTDLKTAITQQNKRRTLMVQYAANQLSEANGDYNEIKGKKSLGKPGAEKICSLYGVTIGEPEIAEDVYEHLPQSVKDAGVIVFKTKLYRNGDYIGAGVGARKLSQDTGDINKSVKMARKSSLIDAVLSTFGLSDLFTQDLEDMQTNQVVRSQNHNVVQSTPKANNITRHDLLRKTASELLKQNGIDPEFYEAYFTITIDKPKPETTEDLQKVVDDLRTNPGGFAAGKEAK